MALLLDLLSEYEMVMDKEDNEEWSRKCELLKLAKERFECLKESYQTKVQKPGWFGMSEKFKELVIEYQFEYCQEIEARVLLVEWPDSDVRRGESFIFCNLNKEQLQDEEKKKENRY